MLAWMKKNHVALLVATLMFAVMASVMAEFLLLDDASVFALFDEPNHGTSAMLWTWRIGGLLTWPVFMWLLLRPFVDSSRQDHRSCLARTLGIAALYGGGGLWLLSSLWTALTHVEEGLLVLVAPGLAVLMLGMPYLYTWGFVAIYGFTRDQLQGRSEHGWMGKSLTATVLGVYAIGPLIYAALSLILVPVIVSLDAMPGEVGTHVAFDLFAIALSTGNFASQWFAFSRVDEWYDEQERLQRGMTPEAAPAAPTEAVSTMNDGTVILPDGRLVTPDGHVYLPQSMPVGGSPQAQAPGSAPQAPPVAPATAQQPAQDPSAPQQAEPAPPQTPPSPYDYGAGGWTEGQGKS